MAKDADETIEECLNSLVGFDEVILYLNDSSDQTKSIAETFSNVKIIEGDFIGFGPTKNKAASYAKNEWILSLDSDEVLNKTLIEEISRQEFHDTSNLFILKRDNYFLGARTVSQDFIVRIYNKTHTAFNNNMVHEKVIVQSNSRTKKLYSRGCL